MKKVETLTPKAVAKKDTNKAKATKKTPKKEVIQRSNWKLNVLAPNAEYKKLNKTFGKVRQMILALDDTERKAVNLLPLFEEILTASVTPKKATKIQAERAQKVYKWLKPLIRVSTAGNYGIFYTISSLHKIVNNDETFNEYQKLVANNVK